MIFQFDRHQRYRVGGECTLGVDMRKNSTEDEYWATHMTIPNPSNTSSPNNVTISRVPLSPCEYCQTRCKDVAALEMGIARMNAQSTGPMGHGFVRLG